MYNLKKIKYNNIIYVKTINEKLSRKSINKKLSIVIMFNILNKEMFMTKNFYLSIVIFTLLVFCANCLYASELQKNRNDFLKTRALMGVNAGGASAEPAFAPASMIGYSKTKPSYTLYNSRDEKFAPVPVNPGDYFFCVCEPHKPSTGEQILYKFIKSDHFSCVYTNLMSFEETKKIKLRLYHSFKDLLITKNAYILQANKDNHVLCDNNTMINFFLKAKPLKKISLQVKVNVRSILNGVNKTEKCVINDNFEKCDAILGNMTEILYGNGCTMFKPLEKTFPGIIAKLSVPDKNNPSLIKLYKPVISVEMIALDMNGKDKHATIFVKDFPYETIKTSTNYNWTK